MTELWIKALGSQLVSGLLKPLFDSLGGHTRLLAQQQGHALTSGAAMDVPSIVS